MKKFLYSMLGLMFLGIVTSSYAPAPKANDKAQLHKATTTVFYLYDQLGDTDDPASYSLMENVSSDPWNPEGTETFVGISIDNTNTAFGLPTEDILEELGPNHTAAVIPVHTEGFTDLTAYNDDID